MQNICCLTSIQHPLVRIELQAFSLQALFTLYGFNYPLTVAFLQMAVIAPVCYAVARPKLEWGVARGTLPLAMVNVLNVVSGLIGKHYTTSASLDL